MVNTGSAACGGVVLVTTVSGAGDVVVVPASTVGSSAEAVVTLSRRMARNPVATSHGERLMKTLFCFITRSSFKGAGSLFEGIEFTLGMFDTSAGAKRRR